MSLVIAGVSEPFLHNKHCGHVTGVPELFEQLERTATMPLCLDKLLTQRTGSLGWINRLVC
jgi:hypothetical protein